MEQDQAEAATGRAFTFGGAPAWQWALVLGCAVLAVLHQRQWLSQWVIDDAAISFAYARNLANGEGLVPFPGGEWVEGYSNPSWVALLAVASWLGVGGFTASAVLGAALGALAVPLAWLAARAALPGEAHPGALVAPVLLASSAQHAIWTASRLENPLFTCALLGGAAALGWAYKRERAGWAWVGAACFGLLAVTRPEGLMYGLMASAWVVVEAGRRGRWRLVLGWLALLWVPFVAYQAVRYQLFAWPLPNTFYAKVGTSGSHPLDWNARGWFQVRGYTAELGVGWLLPLVLVGSAAPSRRGRAGLLLAACCVGLALLMPWPGPDWLRALAGLGKPEAPSGSWPAMRVGLIGVAAVIAPLAGLFTPLGAQRGLLAHLLAGGLLFAVVSDGDWMEGYRWMSLLAGPLAVLVAVGAAEVGAAGERLLGRSGEAPGALSGVVLALAALGPVQTQLAYTQDYSTHPEDFPEMIKRRVDHTQALTERLFLDRVVNLDMDMGGHLWWSDDELVDLAGLLDVPIAMHDFKQSAFMREYIFRERKPTVAHVHRWWASASRLPDYPEWRAQYLQMPGYKEEGGVHGGIWLRREVLLKPGWSGPDAASFEGGAELAGVVVPARDVPVGGPFFVELGVVLPAERQARSPRFSVLFLRGERVVSRAQVAYGHGLLRVEEAKPGEVAVMRVGLDVASLPEGEYQLAFQWVEPDGVPRAALSEAEGLPVGAVALSGGLRVVSQAEAEAASERDLAAAVRAAAEGDCAGAEAYWDAARRRLLGAPAWAQRRRPGEALAGCYARRALSAPDEAVASFEAARHWDHRSPVLRELRAGPVAALIAAGHAAREAGRWHEAYRAYGDALLIDPAQPWVRRYAEEARDHRLGYAHD